jgi:excinuclease ABC subunit A
VLYVLDEPSIGLHQRDNERLIATLHRLRDLGNTVLVVEHDEETMRAADWLVDLGPGAGPHGGELLAAGPPDAVARDPKSLTGRYLSGTQHVGGGRRRQTLLSAGHLVIHEAAEHNLKGVTVQFPVGLLTCVTGVSGSGKSTLVDDILRRALARWFYHAKDVPGRHREITGLEHFDKLVVVDQDPIGRSPRSNPVTYLGVFTEIRKLFASLPASKVRGFTAGTFSFNTKGGRCEACEGDGQLRIDMHFLTDVFVTCDACGGRRYQRDVLDVTYKGRSVADVLEMSFEEATAFFRSVPQVSEKLRTVCLVGLGYLRLGQGANTLSGGEAQRLKLAAELGKRATGRTLYLLDEPTTGLHFQDIEVLLGVLFRLRDAGNTLIVIEHNLDVIRSADWIVDLGPGGGEAGGRLVAEGPPEAIAACEASETGRFLRRFSQGVGQ